MPCDAIRIGDRYRKDLGDLEGQAASIAAGGLLQPIGITEQNVLVCGERRLRAFQDVLRRETIQARIVHVGSITAEEFAENEIRKDFTAPERVAIGKALEAELGNRQGQRTDVELRPNCAKVEPGTRTEDIAARKAGFGSRDTYEQAKKVVEKAVDVFSEDSASSEAQVALAREWPPVWPPSRRFRYSDNCLVAPACGSELRPTDLPPWPTWCRHYLRSIPSGCAEPWLQAH